MNGDELKTDEPDEANRDMRDSQKEEASKLHQNMNCISNAGSEKGKPQNQQHVQVLQSWLPPQPFQRPQVCWDRFLPVRSLKVLLAEYDDSTRHIVSALLQNCGYEVTSVSNGLEAWKILEDTTNHIDLVLTEVVMPVLSGIGLLSKIMSHIGRKSVPVIMMSSHDSMSIVYNCLSKGAVDYLIKPIRKNELKILWQHVWRKCSSSSGSGSESGIRTQRPTTSESFEESDNSTGNENEYDTGSHSLNRDGSENGSGTQGSWTERTVEVSSARPTTSWNQPPAHPTGSTSAPVNFSRIETVGSNLIMPTTAANKGSAATRKAHSEEPSRNLQINNDGVNNDNSTGMTCKNNDCKQKSEELKLNSKKPNGDITDPIQVRIITNSNEIETNVEKTKMLSSTSRVSDMKGKTINVREDILPLELTLRRSHDKHTENGVQEWNSFRQSDISAFSRYNSTATANQTPNGFMGKHSSVHKSSGAAKTKSTQNHQSIYSKIQPNQGSNRSNNINLGSTTVSAPTPLSKSAVNCLRPPSSSAVSPVQNELTDSFKPTQRQVNSLATKNQFLSQPTGKNYEDTSQKEMMLPASQCESSNMPCGAQVNGNLSTNGSGSGSNNGSNGQNGCSVGFNPTVKHIESDNEVCGKRRASLETEYVEKQNLSLRDAAVNKFLRKRKERCFEKKIRYHSRKKLAEKRPRVHGQFVRKEVKETKHKDTANSIQFKRDPDT